MEVEIWSGTAKAIIDPQGGYLTNLSDEAGDIIFPKRTIKNAAGEQKIRGGCHVCLPNFGPGGESNLPQHGFGRDMSWEVTDSTDNSVLLTLKNGRDGYEDLESVVTYQLSDTRLLITLEIINNGKKPLRVAPAFHPYFYVAGDEATIDGKTEQKHAFADTVFEKGEGRTLTQGSRTITVSSENLPVWALWTDELGQYFCVEPTVNGYAFLSPQKDDESLAPEASKTYKTIISWS